MKERFLATSYRSLTPESFGRHFIEFYVPGIPCEQFVAVTFFFKCFLLFILRKVSISLDLCKCMQFRAKLLCKNAES